MSVGQRIRRIRQVMGLSQVDLAEKMRVSKQTLYKYEHDIITNIPSDKIELAAQALGTTPEYLMGWEKKEHLSAYYALIMAEIYGINDEGLKRILQYAKDIKDKYRKGENDAKKG